MADEALLEELLSVWQREAERGHNLTAPDLCRGRPELAAELEGRIRAVRQMNGLRLQADQTLTQKPFDLQAEGPRRPRCRRRPCRATRSSASWAGAAWAWCTGPDRRSSGAWWR